MRLQIPKLSDQSLQGFKSPSQKLICVTKKTPQMLTRGDTKELIKMLGELSFEAFGRALKALRGALRADLGAQNKCFSIGNRAGTR